MAWAAPSATSEPIAAGALAAYTPPALWNSNILLEDSLKDAAGLAAIAAISPKRPLRSQIGLAPNNPPTAALTSAELNSTLESLTSLLSSLNRSPAVNLRRSVAS